MIGTGCSAGRIENRMYYLLMAPSAYTGGVVIFFQSRCGIAYGEVFYEKIFK